MQAKHVFCSECECAIRAPSYDSVYEQNMSRSNCFSPEFITTRYVDLEKKDV